MAVRSRPRGGQIKDEFDEERSLWNQIRADARRIDQLIVSTSLILNISVLASIILLVSEQTTMVFYSKREFLPPDNILKELANSDGYVSHDLFAQEYRGRTRRSTTGPRNTTKSEGDELWGRILQQANGCDCLLVSESYGNCYFAAARYCASPYTCLFTYIFLLRCTIGDPYDVSIPFALTARRKNPTTSRRRSLILQRTRVLA
jgi:hypothetical protein